MFSCKNAGHKPNDPAVDSSANKAVNEAAATTKNTNGQIMAKPQVPVLCYHRIENGRNDEYTVSPAGFDAQMKILRDSGYQSVLPGQLYDYLLYNKPLPAKPVMITFDDTRLEHATIGEPVLSKYGFKGVYFIMTISIGKKNYMSREQIKKLADDGNAVASHTWDHHMVTKYTPQDWQTQIVGSNKTISEITGKPVEYFAYPFGINDHTAAVELAKYYKLSFILSQKRDSTMPLQMVRRMIVPYSYSPQGMLKVMHNTFEHK